jgi:hypothetical protein
MEERQIVAAQLTALKAGSAARWRAFRRMEVVCTHRGCLLLEVLATTPPAIVIRQVENPTADAETQRLGRMRVRSGEPAFWLFADAPEVFTTSCKCQSPAFLREFRLTEHVLNARRNPTPRARL